MVRPSARTAPALAVLAASILAGGLVAAVSAPARGRVDHVALQARMNEMAEELGAADLAGDADGVAAAVRAMADLDPEHPKIYTRIATLGDKAREYTAAAALMATTGSSGAGSRFGEGILQFKQGQHEAAAESLREAIEAYRETRHVAGLAYAHAWHVQPLIDLGRLDDAAESARKGAWLFGRLGDPVRNAEMLSTLADIEASRGRYDDALVLYRRGLTAVERADDLEKQIGFWDSIGSTLQDAQRCDEAIEALTRAVQLRERSGDLRRAAGTLLEIARCHTREGRHDEAEATYLEAIATDTRVHGEAQAAVTRFLMIGEWALDYGDPAEAEAALDELIGYFPDSGLRFATSYELGSRVYRTSALIKQGRFGEARRALASVLQQAIDMPHAFWEAAARTNLANVALAEGRFTQALLEQQAAAEFYRVSGNSAKLLLSLNNLGAIYLELDDPVRCEEHLDEALELARSIPDRANEALVLSNLGVLRLEAGDPAGALEFQRNAQRLWSAIGDDRRVATSRLLRAAALAETARSREARTAADRALEAFRKLDDPAGTAGALNVIAGILADEATVTSRQRAVEMFGEARDVAEMRGLQEEHWKALAGRGAALAELGRLEDARRDYLGAIEVLEGQRAVQDTGEFRARVFARKADVFERAIEVELRVAGSDDVAPSVFELSERFRARGVVELLAESAGALRDSIPADLAERDAALRDAVTAAATRLVRAPVADAEQARAELSAAESELRRFEIELRRGVPRFAELTYPQPSDLPEVQAALKPDETLLVYVLGGVRSTLWAIEPREVRRYDLDPREAIEAGSGAWLELAARAEPTLGDRGRAAGLEAAGRALLPETLDLRPGRRLLVVPDGPLHHLPFDALVREGRALLEDHEVIVVPSATALVQLRRQPRAVAAPAFLGVGAPNVANERFPALPHSLEALDAIAGMFPRSRRAVLTGDDATRQALLGRDLSRFGYVHFATHGWLDPRVPSHSGLVLSGADGAEELLYVEDVFAMRLAPALVVLAACRSGQGELLRGEGLVGLSRAFLYAGARSLLVTLWNVDDRTTAEFMQAFYGRVTRGVRPAAALRETKLEFLNSDRPALRQPNRWAPFVLIGDSR